MLYVQQHSLSQKSCGEQEFFCKHVELYHIEEGWYKTRIKSCLELLLYAHDKNAVLLKIQTSASHVWYFKEDSDLNGKGKPLSSCH